MQLYLREDFSLPAQASFFLICVGYRVEDGYGLRIMRMSVLQKRVLCQVRKSSNLKSQKGARFYVKNLFLGFSHQKDKLTFSWLYMNF